MSKAIPDSFKQFRDNLRGIEGVNYDLRTVRPDPEAASPIAELEEFRSSLSAKASELYERIDIIIGQLQYDLLQPYSSKFDDYNYEFFKLQERYRDLRVENRKAQLRSKQLELASTEEEEGEEEDEVEAAEEGNKKDGGQGPARTYLDDEKLTQLNKKQQVLDKNEQITGKLQNITTMLQTSLMTSEVNIQDMQSSTAQLADLSQKYGVFGDMLVRTNSLVKTINESSNRERRQIYRSLYFFGAVCCWVLWRRIFKRPVMLAVWVFFNLFKYILLGSKKVITGARKPASMSVLATPGTAGTTAGDIETAVETAISISTEIISSDVVLDTVTAIVNDTLNGTNSTGLDSTASFTSTLRDEL